jgi:hypothetical protein
MVAIGLTKWCLAPNRSCSLQICTQGGSTTLEMFDRLVIKVAFSGPGMQIAWSIRCRRKLSTVSRSVTRSLNMSDRLNPPPRIYMLRLSAHRRHGSHDRCRARDREFRHTGRVDLPVFWTLTALGLTPAASTIVLPTSCNKRISGTEHPGSLERQWILPV